MTSAFPSLRTRPTLPAVVGVSRASSVYLRSSTATTVHSSVTSLNSLFNQSTSPDSPRPPRDKDEDGDDDDDEGDGDGADLKSLICGAFVPHVAVLVSDDTNDLAREKGFANFKDMVGPYGERIHGRITVRDSQGISTSHDDFGVRFVEMRDVAKNRGGGGRVEEVEEIVNLHLERAEEEDDAVDRRARSVYGLYLRRMLSAMPVSPHETFSHPAACVIAISSRNHAPIDSLRSLYNSGNQMALPGYVGGDYLRYYVLVHDEDGDDIKKSTLLFDQMKKHFGLHCHLLRLRSGGASVVSDDDAVVVPKCLWVSAAEELDEIRSRDYRDDDDGRPATCLPDSDATGIQTMVREMVQVSVVPFMERCVATWNDQVASRRRGISGRFISMSKRYFGGSSSRGSAASSSNYDPHTASYPPTAPEAQMRKLADYAFMLRDWRLAHGVYELLRTDFNNDKAWKYHAGAQEMAAISLILTGTGLTTKVRADTISPMLDLACYSYLARCSSTYCAIRCLLVAVELLRIRGGGAADEAATWAVRAREALPRGGTGHALVTERVGACYGVRGGIGSGAWGARKRKAAMWRMLAAREWLEVGRPAQARRCLDKAAPAYRRVGFELVCRFVRHLEGQAGYMTVDDGDGEVDGGAAGEGEELEVQSEMLDAGLRRKGAAGGERLEGGGGEFVDR